MNIEEKINLITKNLYEIVEKEELKNLLKSKKKLTAYWGTMPTGSPHISYFLPLIIIKNLLEAGINVKILLADFHAALDGVSWKLLEKRTRYYELLMKEMLETIKINTKNLTFIKGSSIQLKPSYVQDLLKLSMLTNINQATKAASEVVKMKENPKLGNLLYPLMQALDEEYLQADIQLGGLDQRKILVFAREFLPKVGYKKRVELMHPIIAGLVGKKMSSSVSESKIDLLDDEKTVISKINKAEFDSENPDNGVMHMIKFIIFPIKNKFILERSSKFGGDKVYENYESLENELSSKKMHPLDIKNSLAKEINSLIEPIRKNKTLQKLYKEAYD